MTASGKIRWRFFPKSNTAPKVGISFPPWLTTRQSVLLIEGVNFLDTYAKNSEAARKSISSEFISVQGCSSKEIFRDKRANPIGEGVRETLLFLQWVGQPDYLLGFVTDADDQGAAGRIGKSHNRLDNLGQG